MEGDSSGLLNDSIVEIEYDVTLVVDEHKFQCKKSVLAEHSSYFKAMFYNDFIEKDKNVVELHDLSPLALDIVLKALNDDAPDWLKCSNILDVLETSCMLQFDTVREKCVQFIIDHWMNYETWLPVSTIANKLGLVNLEKMAEAKALWNFSKVKKTDGFLDLPTDELIKYLNHDWLRVTESEFEVFEAGCNWIDRNLDDRLFYSLDVLKTVRFNDMSAFDIKSMLHYSIVRDTPQLELILQCILEIKDGTLNQSCEVCNPTIEDEDSQELPGSPQSPSFFSSNSSFKFIKSLKRKRRTTSHCTCFDTCTITTAQSLLAKDKRSLPLIPCFVGTAPSENYKGDNRYGSRKEMSPNVKWPCLFCWDEKDVTPFLHLSKIDEGTFLAMGYKIVMHDFKFYITGGEYQIGYSNWNNSMWGYDILKKKWEYESSMPSPRRHHHACIVNNDIYLIGGVGKFRVILNSVIKYSLDKKIWENCCSLPVSFYSTACCVYKEEIFLFGPPVMCYRSNTTNTWDVLDEITLPENIIVAVALTHKDLIYIIASGISNLYSFKPHQEVVTFEYLGKFKTSSKNACIVNNSIYSFGEDAVNQRVELYNIDSGEFQVLWETKIEETMMPYQSAGCFALPKYF